MAKSKQYYVWIGLDGYIIKHLTRQQALGMCKRGKKWVGNPTDTWEEAEKLRQHIDKEQLRKLLEGYVQETSSL